MRPEVKTKEQDTDKAAIFAVIERFANLGRRLREARQREANHGAAKEGKENTPNSE